MNGNQTAKYGILRTWTSIMRRHIGCPFCTWETSLARRGPGANALATAAKLKGMAMAHMRDKHQAELAAGDPLTEPQQRMLDVIRKHGDTDGWADWDHVYPDWEPTNVPVQFGGRAAQQVWKNLEKRGLVEQRKPDMKVRVVPDAK